MAGKKMQLGRWLYECPQSWQNFIEHLDETGCQKNNDESFSVDTLNKELSWFEAEYHKDDLNPYIDFNDENGYKLFVLVHG